MVGVRDTIQGQVKCVIVSRGKYLMMDSRIDRVQCHNFKLISPFHKQVTLVFQLQQCFPMLELHMAQQRQG